MKSITWQIKLISFLSFLFLPKVSIFLINGSNVPNRKVFYCGENLILSRCHVEWYSWNKMCLFPDKEEWDTMVVQMDIAADLSCSTIKNRITSLTLSLCHQPLHIWLLDFRNFDEQTISLPYTTPKWDMLPKKRAYQSGLNPIRFWNKESITHFQLLKFYLKSSKDFFLVALKPLIWQQANL